MLGHELCTVCLSINIDINKNFFDIKKLQLKISFDQKIKADFELKYYKIFSV